MNETYKEIWDDLIRIKRAWCYLCHARRAITLHHCIVHRRKGHPEYDTRENLEPLCEVCHTSLESGECNGYEHRKKFWKDQVARGFDMKGWYSKLKLYAKENFE